MISESYLLGALLSFGDTQPDCAYYAAVEFRIQRDSFVDAIYECT